MICIQMSFDRTDQLIVLLPYANRHVPLAHHFVPGVIVVVGLQSRLYHEFIEEMQEKMKYQY